MAVVPLHQGCSLTQASIADGILSLRRREGRRHAPSEAPVPRMSTVRQA